MRICDRCHGRDGSAVKSSDEVSFAQEHIIMDLCATCREEVKAFVLEPAKPAHHRPPKRKAVKPKRKR